MKLTTIRELFTNPCRDIVEGRTKIPTVRCVPWREFQAPARPLDRPILERVTIRDFFASEQPKYNGGWPSFTR